MNRWRSNEITKLSGKNTLCEGSSEKHSGNLFTDYVPTVIQATRLLYGLNQETWENLLKNTHSKLETSRKKKLGWSHTKQANEDATANLSKNNTSRMTGDSQVRFCERIAGETPACLLGG